MKNRKKKIILRLSFGQNYLTLQICGKRLLLLENAGFCDGMVFGSDLSSFGEKTVKG